MALKPLQGIRVADFGQVIAGPILAHILADFGAQVIRVESAGATDNMRKTHEARTPLRELLEGQHITRNRLCVSLNLTKPEAVKLAKQIVQQCDVVLENFSPKVFRRFGLDYDSLRQIRPDIIMVSMSAAGQTGPLQNLLGYGPSVNAVAGTDSLLGYFGDHRLMINMLTPDYTTPATAAMAVLAALHHRDSTGQGQYIDLSFYETMACLLGEALMDYTMNGRVAKPQGNRHPGMAPHGIYPCAGKDRWISIAVQTEQDWSSLCEVMARPSWTREERFADLYARLQHREELDKLLAGWTSQFEAYELMHRLQRAGVAAVPVFTLEDVYLDPHHELRRTSVTVETEGLSRRDVAYGIPWKLSETPGTIQMLAHKMGQDNEEVLTELVGLSREEMKRLVDEQVVW